MGHFQNISTIASKLFNNTWVITLTATLVGVFLALYLSELVSNNKLDKQTAIATKNVLSEIEFNKEKFERAKEKHTKALEIITFMNNYYDWDNGGIVAASDSLHAIQRKYPSTFVMQDSMHVKEEIYNYEGELNLDFSLPELEVTTIAWKTLKESGISGTYGFECLLYLERLYNVTNDVLVKNKEAFSSFTRIDENNQEEIFNNSVFKLKFLIKIEEALIEMLAISEEKLNNCG